jgi:hypothetical protein
MKKTIIIILILIVLGILGFIAYNSLASKIPQAFLDKHNETVALGKEAQQLSDLENTSEMETLTKQMSSEDYSGALKSIEAALGKKNSTSAKLAAIDKKIIEMKALSSEISNAKIKTGTEKFIDMSKKENSAKITFNNLQIQMGEKLKAMLSILAKNSKTISADDEKTIDNLSKQVEDLKIKISNAEKEMNDIQSQYKEAEKEFFALAGLEAK